MKPESQQAKNRRKGAECERMAEAFLHRMGYKCVAPIETGKRKDGSCKAKVQGDFRAVGRAGQSVLVEVKWRETKLPFSALEKHQVEALSDHCAAEGKSLLIWVCERGMVALEWPVR